MASVTISSRGRTMAAGAEEHPEGTHVRADDRVRQVPLPSGVRERGTLAHVDYDDAFLVDTGSASDRTGEQWALAIIEGAPTSTQRALRRGWWALGLRLGPTRSDRFVLGWEVRRTDSDLALLGASGRLGLSGELLFEPGQDTLLFATFVQLDNPVARAMWRGMAPHHRKVVRHLLERAAAPHWSEK
jgi:hypothetical protein